MELTSFASTGSRARSELLLISDWIEDWIVELALPPASNSCDWMFATLISNSINKARIRSCVSSRSSSPP